VATLSSTIWQLLHDQPEVLASPYARVVLRKNGAVGIAIDRRDTKELLGVEDLAFVFLQEHPVAVKYWIDGLRRDLNSSLQKYRTEEFARFLVQALMFTVKQEMTEPWLQQA
jgi:hypothetical protein